MRRTIPLLALATACGAEAPPPPSPIPPPASAPAAAPAPPAPRPPELRLPHTASPARVTASITVVPGRPAFEGVVDIDAKVNEPARVIWLNASGLTITEAHADALGKAFPARPVEGGEDFVGLVFDEPVPAGPARLHVAYRGKVSDKDDRGVFVEDEEGAPYVFTQFEATDARRAFPCFDEPSYKIPWQLTLHVRAEDVALSNTAVVSQTPEDGGMKAVRFEETKPLPSYLVAFAVGPFELVDAGKAGKKGVPVRVAVPRGQKAQARYAAATATEVLRRLEDVTGVPFPYEKLDLVPVPRLVTFGAMENAGLITFARRLLLARPEEETTSFKIRFAAVAAHELGHHWFGDLVTTAWWDDIWLNEAFASWVEAKVLVPWKPEWHYELSRARSTAFAMNGDALVSARFIRQPIGSNDDIQNAFDEITYSKGAAVIGMWEAESIGQPAFHDALRDYLVAHAHGNATAADFMAAMSAKLGTDVEPEFSTFLQQPGVPLVIASLECSDPPAAGTPAPPPGQRPEPRAHVQLSQQRYLPLGSEGAPPAHWEIPVCVRWTQDGRRHKDCVRLTEQTRRIPLGGSTTCPAWYVVNDGASGYYVTEVPTPAVAAALKSGQLSLTERFALLRDTRALVASGHLDVADALARLPEILKEPHPQILRGALDLVGSIRDPMIPPAARPHFARFVQKIFGARARQMGWKAKPKDDEQVRLLRPALLPFVADRGEDAALAAEAVALGRRWLDDAGSDGGSAPKTPGAVEDDMVDAVLAVTAQHGDKALFERIRDAWKKTKDDNRKAHLLGAMRSFRDPALVAASLAMLLADGNDVRDTTGLLFQDPLEAGVGYDFVKQHYDEIVARLPSDFVGRLPGVAEPFCDEARRADVEAFFKDRAPKLLGGPRNLAKVLERIRLCSAQRRAEEAGLTKFLEKF